MVDTGCSVTLKKNYIVESPLFECSRVQNKNHCLFIGKLLEISKLLGTKIFFPASRGRASCMAERRFFAAATRLSILQ